MGVVLIVRRRTVYEVHVCAFLGYIVIKEKTSGAHHRTSSRLSRQSTKKAASVKQFSQSEELLI